MKGVSQKTGIAIIIIIAIILFIRMKVEKNNLNKNGVYVVGKMVKSYFGGSDHGWMYEYEYFFEGNRYTRDFGGPLGIDIQKGDSLLFFRILPKNPKISRQNAALKVPECYRMLDWKKEYWKKLFDCSN